jgi:hypothetical protein
MRLDAIRDGVMSVRQGKTGKYVWVPVHRDLKAVLGDIPRLATTVLTSTDGTPWTTDGFKSSWTRAFKVPNQNRKLAVRPTAFPLWPMGGHVARSWLHRCRGGGDHRAVARDGRALRQAGEPEEAGGLGNPQVGERLGNRYCKTACKTRRVAMT